MLTEYRGQGFATEAAKEVTEWALKNYDIPYLIGTAVVDNVSSQRVLERCGYQLVDTRTLLLHITNKRTILSITGIIKRNNNNSI